MTGLVLCPGFAAEGAHWTYEGTTGLAPGRAFIKGLEVALDIEQLLYEATHSAECRKSDQPDRPAKLSDLDRWGRTENQAPPQRECNSDRPYAGHDCCQRAIILLRFDWLTGLIGALLW